MSVSGSDGTLKAIQNRFRAIERLGQAGQAGQAGQHDHSNHEHLWRECQVQLMEIMALSAMRDTQLRYEHEFAMREGIVSRWQHGNQVCFAWRDPRTGKERHAEIYPNAQNHGGTHGLKTWAGSRNSGNEKWHGADWDYDDAFAAAKAWANDGVPPTHPLRTVEEIMDR